MKSLWRKGLGVSRVGFTNPGSADHHFFHFLSARRAFLPPPTPLWHLPMRKSRHHKAATAEMETLRAGTTHWHSCPLWESSEKEGGIFFFCMSVHGFSKCQDICESVSKNGGKKKFWDFNRAVAHSETESEAKEKDEVRRAPGDGGTVPGAAVGCFLLLICKTEAKAAR